MRKSFGPLLFFLIFLQALLSPGHAFSEEYTVVFNVLPPIKFEQNGQIHGIAGDVLLNIMKNAGHPISAKSFEIMSVQKAAKRTQTDPKSIFIGYARTPSREHNFKWVGPVYHGVVGFIGLKKDAPQITSVKDLMHYSVGSVKDSAAERASLNIGVPLDHLTRFDTVVEAIEQLSEKKLDLVVLPKSPTYYVLIQNGYDIHDYTVAYEMKKIDFYIAFNKATDDALIERLNQEVVRLKQPEPHDTSLYDKIVLKYFRPLN